MSESQAAPLAHPRTVPEAFPHCTNEHCRHPNPRIQIDRIRREIEHIAALTEGFCQAQASSLSDPNIRGHARISAMLVARLESELALDGQRKAIVACSMKLRERIQALYENVHIDVRTHLLYSSISCVGSRNILIAHAETSRPPERYTRAHCGLPEGYNRSEHVCLA